MNFAASCDPNTSAVACVTWLRLVTLNSLSHVLICQIFHFAAHGCFRIVSGWTNNLVVRDTVFVGFNTSDTYPITTCCHCNFPNSKNQGTKTTHFERVEFFDSLHKVQYGNKKRAILHDVDGSLSGTAGVTCILYILLHCFTTGQEATIVYSFQQRTVSPQYFFLLCIVVLTTQVGLATLIETCRVI